MNSAGMVQQTETNAFDERFEVLSNELELAIKWDRSSALLVVYNSEYIRADAETALENYLTQQGQMVVHIKMDDTPGFNLLSILQNYPANDDQVFFINEKSQAASGQPNIFSKLGHHKDILIDKKLRLVIWVSPRTAADMLRSAPDFWEYRQRIIEFTDPPKPEHILQNAIETVWQGIDENKDTEDKIILRDSLFTGESKHAEKISQEDGLLLTLGILNWRKGNHEKASELLQKAIKAAAKLEDNLFEAECFNAIALVYFSQGKHDEAIDAYKQAIAIAPEQIFVWNNLGNLCMKIMRNDEAMLAFQKALKHNEKDPVAWNGLGAVYYALGYLDDSITAYQRAIEYAPTLAHSWSGLGDAYIRVGRDQDAIEVFQKAIKLNNDFLTPHLRLAEIYGRQGRNKDAIKIYQRALNLSPNDHQIWNDVGQLYLKVNYFEEAAQAFLKAIELRPDFGWAYCNLAEAYAKQNKYVEAIELCRKSLSVFTENSDKAASWDRLASYFRAVHEYDKAVQAYQMADQLKGHGRSDEQKPASDSPIADPVSKVDSPLESPHPEATPIQADNDWDKNTITLMTELTEEQNMSTFFGHPILRSAAKANAAKKLHQSIPFDEEMPESKIAAVWNEKGNIHFRKGAFNDAATAYNKAIELDRTFGWPYSNLALTYLTLGKYAEAILLYQKSICLLNTDEEKAASWNSLGNIYRRLNNYEKALEAYQHADQSDPQNAGKRDKEDLAYSESNSQNAQVWQELGNLFFKAGSYAEAGNAYAKAVKIDPTSGWSQSSLAASLVHEGRYKEAIPVYIKSIELFTDNNDKAASWNHLGNAYRRMNDYENAKKAYQNAEKLADKKTALLTRARFSMLENCYQN
ncbi:MAG: tetratricopeptide repeat protein [Chloroflexi bacterium]|nr:tetratricopeptide repeat protein [Chloroflexota bacterium]